MFPSDGRNWQRRERLLSWSPGFVGWEAFRPELDKALARKARDKGRPPFDAVLMFKILVLQARYDLPDEQSEYQILDRLSFMKFLRLERHFGVPDTPAIWLFRDTPISARRIARRGPRRSLKPSARLFFLPPYAPDRYRDELAWKHLKANAAGRMAVTGKGGFQSKVQSSIRQLQNDAEKIRSSHQKPSRKYAA
jgi:hypothetical protein